MRFSPASRLQGSASSLIKQKSAAQSNIEEISGRLAEVTNWISLSGTGLLPLFDLKFQGRFGKPLGVSICEYVIRLECLDMPRGCGVKLGQRSDFKRDIEIIGD
jgi:hypothetical protein